MLPLEPNLGLVSRAATSITPTDSGSISNAVADGLKLQYSVVDDSVLRGLKEKRFKAKLRARLDSTRHHCAQFRNDPQLALILAGDGFSPQLLKGLYPRNYTAEKQRWVAKADALLPLLDVHFPAIRLVVLCDGLRVQDKADIELGDAATESDKIIQGVIDIDDEHWKSNLRHALAAVSASDDFTKSRATLLQEMQTQDNQAQGNKNKQGSNKNRLARFYGNKLSQRAIELCGNPKINTPAKFQKVTTLGASLGHFTDSTKFGLGILAVMPLMEFRSRVITRSLHNSTDAHWHLLAELLSSHDQLKRGIRALAQGPGQVLIDAYKAGGVTQETCQAVRDGIEAVSQSLGLQLPTTGALDGYELRFDGFDPGAGVRAGLRDVEAHMEHVFGMMGSAVNPLLSVESLLPGTWLREDAVFSLLFLQKPANWKIIDGCSVHKPRRLRWQEFIDLLPFSWIIPLEQPLRGSGLKHQSYWGFWCLQVGGEKRTAEDIRKRTIHCTWFDSTVADPLAAQSSELWAADGDHFEGYDSATTALEAFLPNLSGPVSGVNWEMATGEGPFYGHLHPEDCGLHVVRNAGNIMRGNLEMKPQLSGAEGNSLWLTYQAMLSQFMRRVQG